MLVADKPLREHLVELRDDLDTDLETMLWAKRTRRVRRFSFEDMADKWRRRVVAIQEINLLASVPPQPANPVTDLRLTREWLDRAIASAASRSALPDKPSAETAGFTVTEAAEKLRVHLPHLDLKRARARVSRAAGEKFLSTGKRTARRIDRATFSKWLLDIVESDLEQEDLGH